MSLVRRRRHAALAEHATANGAAIGTEHAAALLPHYKTVNDDAVVQTANITITKRCCVVVVSVMGSNEAAQCSQIQRGGVDKTRATTITAVDFAVQWTRGHVQYSAEVLDAGTYTYNVLNTSGGVLGFYGAVMKIVAIS